MKSPSCSTSESTGTAGGHPVCRPATTKLAEVEAKIADLGIIRDTLRAALAAGCDDLVACSRIPSCPLPFADLAEGNNTNAGSCC